MLDAPYLRLVLGALVGALAVALLLNPWTAPPPQSAISTAVTTVDPAAHAVPGSGIGPSYDDSLDALRRELAAVRADLARVKNALEARGNAPASGAAAPAPEDDEDLADPEAQLAAEIAEDQQQIQAYAQTIEASLETETVDSGWSGSTSDRIREVFTGDGLAGASLQDIDCRATLCRVEVQHRDEAKLREFQRVFPFKVSQVLPRLMMHRIENADGSITTYLYLARQGHRLPAAESGN
ncbi:MAG: hypothetical protein L0Y39_11700 [Methylococcaceae bacterium]|nr:hypothetical protein [Methylococcaceae bacterium]